MMIDYYYDYDIVLDYLQALIIGRLNWDGH
jgi:hypothetical protein